MDPKRCYSDAVAPVSSAAGTVRSTSPVTGDPSATPGVSATSVVTARITDLAMSTTAATMAELMQMTTATTTAVPEATRAQPWATTTEVTAAEAAAAVAAMVRAAVSSRATAAASTAAAPPPPTLAPVTSTSAASFVRPAAHLEKVTTAEAEAMLPTASKVTCDPGSERRSSRGPPDALASASETETKTHVTEAKERTSNSIVSAFRSLWPSGASAREKKKWLGLMIKGCTETMAALTGTEGRNEAKVVASAARESMEAGVAATLLCDPPVPAAGAASTTTTDPVEHFAAASTVASHSPTDVVTRLTASSATQTECVLSSDAVKTPAAKREPFASLSSSISTCVAPLTTEPGNGTSKQNQLMSCCVPANVSLRKHHDFVEAILGITEFDAVSPDDSLITLMRPQSIQKSMDKNGGIIEFSTPSQSYESTESTFSHANLTGPVGKTLKIPNLHQATETIGLLPNQPISCDTTANNHHDFVEAILGIKGSDAESPDISLISKTCPQSVQGRVDKVIIEVSTPQSCEPSQSIGYISTEIQLNVVLPSKEAVGSSPGHGISGAAPEKAHEKFTEIYEIEKPEDEISVHLCNLVEIVPLISKEVNAFKKVPGYDTPSPSSSEYVSEFLEDVNVKRETDSVTVCAFKRPILQSPAQHQCLQENREKIEVCSQLQLPHESSDSVSAEKTKKSERADLERKIRQCIEEAAATEKVLQTLLAAREEKVSHNQRKEVCIVNAPLEPSYGTTYSLSSETPEESAWPEMERKLKQCVSYATSMGRVLKTLLAAKDEEESADQCVFSRHTRPQSPALPPPCQPPSSPCDSPTVSTSYEKITDQVVSTLTGGILSSPDICQELAPPNPTTVHSLERTSSTSSLDSSWDTSLLTKDSIIVKGADSHHATCTEFEANTLSDQNTLPTETESLSSKGHHFQKNLNSCPTM